MQVSKKKINKNLGKKVNNFLYQVVSDIKSLQEAKLFLKDLLSKTELSAITKRLAVAYLLKKGENYQEIKKRLKTSSATISAVSEQMEKGKGFEIALTKIAADEWAEKWAEKIKKIFLIN